MNDLLQNVDKLKEETDKCIESLSSLSDIYEFLRDLKDNLRDIYNLDSFRDIQNLSKINDTLQHLQTNMNWIGAAIMRITNHMEESWIKLNNGYKQDIETLEKRVWRLEMSVNPPLRLK